ncbi:hypothetical protein BH11PAT2_BH11PAT2_05900 [soil metagenome]
MKFLGIASFFIALGLIAGFTFDNYFIKGVGITNLRVVRVTDDLVPGETLRIVHASNAKDVARARKERGGAHTKAEVCTPSDDGNGVLDPSNLTDCQAI